MKSEKERWDYYLEWSYKEFFSSITKEDSVLELGPAVGYHTKLILRQDPKILHLVEPDEYSSNKLKKDWIPSCGMELYNKTYEEFYNQGSPIYDVVVCCGLLYHLLAPLHLLEMIVNYSKPKKIIISNIAVDEDGVSPYEYENKVLGRSTTMNNPIKYWHKLSARTVKEVLESVGYKCVKERDTKVVWPKYVYYWQEYSGPV
jgi:2-polyprenyl-3-methyl-5-hydroxy-6-metoxy-1,4-benzoquinol methylase